MVTAKMSVDNSTFNFIYLGLYSYYLICVIIEASEFGKMLNSDDSRQKRDSMGHGLYLFGKNSTEFITIPNLLPNLDDLEENVIEGPENDKAVTKDHTDKSYTEETTYQLNLFPVSTTLPLPSLALPVSPPTVKSEKDSAESNDPGLEINSTMLAKLMMDIDVRLNSFEAAEYFNGLQNDFQRRVVLKNLLKCPFKPLCKFSLNLNHEDYDLFMQPSCCATCSCSQTCVSGGTCCPDVDWFVRKPRVLPQNVEMKCLPTGIRRPGKNFGDHVKAITGCPIYTDPDIVGKCVRKYDKQVVVPVPLEELVMVLDTLTKDVYRNKYCAICNSVNTTNLMTWSAELECATKPPDDITRIEAFTDILEDKLDCDIEFREPGGTEMDIESCANAISTCNVTGLWKHYDQVAETACAMYGHYVYQDYATAYRNIYCAECNGYDISAADICKFRWSQGIYENTFSRMLVLKENTVEELVRDAVEAVCEKGMLFDTIQKRCRAARCTSGRKLVDGECRLIDNANTTRTIDINMRLLAPDGLPLIGGYDMVPKVITTLAELVEQKLPAVVICGVQVILGSNMKKGLLDNWTTKTRESFRNGDMYDIKKEIDNAELDCYDVRLQVTGFLVPDQIARALLALHELKVQLVRDNVNKNLDFNTSISMDEMHGQVEQEKYTFPVQLAHGIHSKKFDLVASVGYFVLTDYMSNAHEIVDIYDVLNYLTLTDDISGTIQFPHLQWNNELALCEFSKDSKDLASFRDCPLFTTLWSDTTWTQTVSGIEFNGMPASIRLDISEYTIERNDDFLTQISLCVDTYEERFSSIDNVTTEQEPVGALTIAKFFISIISVSVSIICLAISLMTYCLFKQLQTITGKNNMALMVSLMLAQSLYVLGSVSGFDTHGVVCKVVGLLTHFFWLLAIFWMNVCTYHMCRVLLRTRNMSNVTGTRKYLLYHTYCISLAIMFICINVLVSMVKSDYSDMGYGKVICFVSTQSMIEYTFGVPAAAVVVANLGMFLAIVIKLKSGPAIEKNVKNERNYFLVFIKLSTVTGVTWVFGFVYMWTAIEAFSFLFILFNATQGVFIMLAFVINKRTLVLYRNRFKGSRNVISSDKRSTMTNMTTPTTTTTA